MSCWVASRRPHPLEIARAIKDCRGEAIAFWNLDLAPETLGPLADTIPLMEVLVRFLQDIGHPDADRLSHGCPCAGMVAVGAR